MNVAHGQVAQKEGHVVLVVIVLQQWGEVLRAHAQGARLGEAAHATEGDWYVKGDGFDGCGVEVGGCWVGRVGGGVGEEGLDCLGDSVIDGGVVFLGERVQSPGYFAVGHEGGNPRGAGSSAFLGDLRFVSSSWQDWGGRRGVLGDGETRKRRAPTW